MPGRRGIMAAVATATLASASTEANNRIMSTTMSCSDRRFGSDSPTLLRGRQTPNRWHPAAAIKPTSGRTFRGEDARSHSWESTVSTDSHCCASSPRDKLVQVLPRKNRQQASTTKHGPNECAAAPPRLLASRRSLRSFPQRAKPQRYRGLFGPILATAAGAAGASRSTEAAAGATATPAEKVVLLARGGGSAEIGRSWFSGGRDDPYEEFPEDFDYEPVDDDLDDDLTCWAGGENELGRDDIDVESGTWDDGEKDGGTADGGKKTGRRWRTSEEDVVEKPSRREKKPGVRHGSSGVSGGSSSSSLTPSQLPTKPVLSPEKCTTENSKIPQSSDAETPLVGRETPVRKKIVGNSSGGVVAPRSVLGAVVGALVGAVGLRMWEGFQRGRLAGGGHEERDGEAGDDIGREQQERIQVLEDQLSYLEEDRRRVAAAAKEARASRRKEERQLKEYVHTLEVHLDQLSKEKLDMEATVVESVRAETSKALEQAQAGHQAALAVAAAEAERLRTDLEATRDSLETALQERAATDALLRTEQGRGAALEKEMERLRDSAAGATQRLLDAVSKAERAERDTQEALAAQAGAIAKAEAAALMAAEAAREEDAARFRHEMETALAEEKERLRKQMEDRLASMRAGLKRRLQEVRAERSIGSGGGSGRGVRGSTTPTGSTGSAPSTARPQSASTSRTDSVSRPNGKTER